MTRDERGATGSMLAIGICLTLTTVFLVGAVLINWFTLARGAEQAAELAALAGASAAVQGEDPCGAAAAAARRNHAALAACEVRGSGAHVVVEVRISTPLRPTLPVGPSSLTRVATAGSV